LKSLPEPVKFPANIDLVVKNYDKLIAALPPIQYNSNKISRSRHWRQRFDALKCRFNI
jgi:hypothetical protein